MEGCGPHCPCWRESLDPFWSDGAGYGEWGYCERDYDKYGEDADYILAGDLSRTKEQELENE